MAPDRILFIRSFVESARAVGTQTSKSLTQVLAEIRNAIFSDELQNGKILISTAEAGGTITFAIPAGHSPLEIMALAQEAIDWCNQFPDPNNPPATARRIRRLRVSFAKAIPS
ncbi:MAG: hypothetical protein QOD03_1279 [Verrucomicrobiota bacterium]|jgi:hypothetical protein